MEFVAFFIFCSFFCSSALAYKAAVYEYYPSTDLTGRDRILKNIDNYETYVDEVTSQSVNIFVFPEYGLTGLEVDPAEYAVEITEEEEVIKRLKTIALSHQVYLVVNLLEKVSESNKQTIYYNTNLVFNREGAIQFKYRKINLYKETKLTPGASNQNLTFTAGFGPTFGVFTGRDILFGNPSRRVLEDSTVKDVVYPSLWYSTMPFLTSLSVQRGYADANGVNLLAAGYGQPRQGHGGSGIYLGTGEVVETYIADTTSSKPIIQEISTLQTRVNKTACPKLSSQGLPLDVGKSNVTNYNTERVLATPGAIFLPINHTSSRFSTHQCQNNFCCYFDLIIGSANPQEVYKGMVFDGEADLGDGTTHYQICSLLACTTDSKDSCGNRFESLTTNFTKIDVRATGFKQADQFGVPVTVNAYLLPVKNTLYCQDGSNTELTTLKGAQNVLAFGLLGKSLSGAAAAVHAYGLFFLIVFTFVKSFVF